MAATLIGESDVARSNTVALNLDPETQNRLAANIGPDGMRVVSANELDCVGNKVRACGLI